MKRRDEHALSPRRHNRQQLTRFSRPRTPRSQDDSAQASSSSVFVASAGFPTQTQQASTWMFAQQTVQNIHPQGQMDSNNSHMQGQVARGQAYQWETNTQSNFGVPVPNQEGQFFMHENKNIQMQKCGNYYSSRDQESYVMHIRNLIHQYIFSLFFQPLRPRPCHCVSCSVALRALLSRRRHTALDYTGCVPAQWSRKVTMITRGSIYHSQIPRCNRASALRSSMQE
jgi:hypothetical protein